MVKRTNIKKILVIGSGPIVIGQAAEFDYAGSQACIALKEEGYQVVLINSNPATIMTDTNIADTVYIEPINVEAVSNILYKEKPDAILPSLGGQIGLNMAVELNDSGILDELNIELIGTDLEAIKKAEDRELFRQTMADIELPTPESTIVHTVEEALKFAKKVGYPIISRPAYTMGGTGGGIIHNEEELKEIVKNGLKLSPSTQCLIEVSIAGYKEIEYEVMRDGNGTSLVICSMENFDPVGIHTGDSIVFAPNQSLKKNEEKLLSNVALKIIDTLGIEGGCNVQMALDHDTMDYYIIEVNPRVSRSSALASKATGFPIARVSAKIAVGINFDEMINQQTNQTFEAYDASKIDYTVCKFPRFSADKFEDSDRLLGTQMKATGEAMSIGHSLEEALLKAIQSLKIDVEHIYIDSTEKASDIDIMPALSQPTDERIFYIAEALRRGMSIETLYDVTKITPLFLKALDHIVDMEVNGDLKTAKKLGFTDETIAVFQNVTAEEVYAKRNAAGIKPTYQQVPVWATSVDNASPYYYSTYQDKTNYNTPVAKESVLVIGSGPIRIGQGIEFDYATVHSVKAIQKSGYAAIIVNSNPETVSTDFSIADKLYFEPLTLESVLAVIEQENPIGVIIQFGGQTSLNLAAGLEAAGVNILGTSVADMNRAEDRKDFEEALSTTFINQPAGQTAFTLEEAINIPESVGGYPVLVRPSYVLGGRGMEVVANEKELEAYVSQALEKGTNGHPILIDHYVEGIEVEVDAVSDGEDVLLPGIMEHVERAGVHSGDSIAVYPPQNLSQKMINTIVDYTVTLAKTLNCVGMMNIQFVVDKQTEDVYVIEVNPRASRTVPFLSKATGTAIAQIATQLILGHKLKDLGYRTGLYPKSDLVYVKAPVFSFSKLNGVDPLLSPEMKSTGEVMGSGHTYEKALSKAFEATNKMFPHKGVVILDINESEWSECEVTLSALSELGFTLSTHTNDMNAVMVVSTQKTNEGIVLRHNAIANGIPLFTAIDTFMAFVKANSEIKHLVK